LLTFRYVGALTTVAGLLVAGQLLVQCALDRQEGDARIINTAGRQRMLGQRLCMLLLAHDAPGEVARVADEWQASQAVLRAGADGDLAALFARIAPDHDAMLAAARGRADPATALAHQEAFLAGMDAIVAAYERDARDRVVALRRTELVLLALALIVLALEGAFVFRPAVRAIRLHLAERDVVERQLLEVSDREQKRLGQDLHDGLGQHLVGVAFLIKSLGQDATPVQQTRLDEIGRLLAEAIDQTRGLARALYSRTLELDGLVAALRELATHTERVYGVPCRIDGDAGELAVPLQLQLYRIAREAVANAAKHARAHAIDIVLDRTSLVVRDDGVGIGAPAGDGMGLHVMAYRARMIGGGIAVTGRPNGGTVVTCTFVPA
jgi:signal transduction histidine kinase